MCAQKKEKSEMTGHEGGQNMERGKAGVCRKGQMTGKQVRGPKTHETWRDLALFGVGDVRAVCLHKTRTTRMDLERTTAAAALSN